MQDGNVPFTGSHPAAVLPLLRTPLPASALIAGSIAPDIPSYLPVALPWETHSALAVVTVDVVLGGLAWALWHALLAPAALSAAPAGLRSRLTGVPLGLRRRLWPARTAGLVLLALVVGAALHVLVDEFTHPGRWGAEHLPLLVVAGAGLVGGLTATANAPDLRSAAVAAAFRGGGVVLATAVLLALTAVLPAPVRGEEGAGHRCPG